MKSLTGLLAFQAISNGALSGTDLPTRIKLLNWGDNQTRKGVVKVGPQTLATLSANQAAFGFDRIGLDYEHQSVPTHPNFKPAPREYAAYGVPEVIDQDGLYLRDIAYTPSGHTNARNYSDLSPVVHQDKDGEVDFLHSTALCPQGAVDGLTFFSADIKIENLKAMNPDLKKLLATLFACDLNSSEEDLLAAGKTFAEKMNAAPDPKKTSASPEVTALSASLEGLTARFEARERAGLLADAIREGKLVPNSAKTLPIEQLTTLIAELPADQVPLEKRTPDHVKALSATVSASDLAVAAQLGLKPEDMAPAR